MLKKRIATEIVVIALALGIALLLPACNKNKSGKDYSGLLKGDFSVVAGTYVTGNGSYRVELKANGETRGRGWIPTVASYSAAYEGWSKTYNWQENPPPESEASPIPWVLWPVGVDVLVDGKIVKTDTSKERITVAGYDPPTAEELLNSLYYRDTSGTTMSVEEPRDYDGPGGGPQDDVIVSFTGPDYLYATTNLRLRSEPDTSKDNRIAGVPQGSRVVMIESGDKFETIDNMTKLWYKVKTEDGTVGWLFSGYLTSDPPASASYDYSKILKGDFSEFAGIWKAGNGDRVKLKSNGTLVDSGYNKSFGFTLEVDGSRYGSYSWGVGSGQDSTNFYLYPVGVEIQIGSKSVQSDTTKVRFLQGYTSSSDEVYYRETSGAAAAPAGSYDYAKILNKDFSDFAGNWKNGNGDRQQLKKDGIFGVNGKEIFSLARETNGAYSWIVGSGQDGWYMKLYPVGTAVPGVQSDTTKVRLTMVMTPDGTASQNEIYYKD